MSKALEGTALVRAVIEKVRSQGFIATFGESNVDEEITPSPVPERVLNELTLDGGLPLSPSMREWLAFDSTFVEWFTDLDGFTFRRRKLSELAEQWLGDRGGAFRGLQRAALPKDCYWLPFGDETMRFLYPSKPDATGEYPVVLLDVDDQPFVSIGYAGIDVYLGVSAGLVEADAPRWIERVRAHEVELLGGRSLLEYGEEGFDELSEEDHEALEETAIEAQANAAKLPAGLTSMGNGRFMQMGGDAVPEGFTVLKEMRNPFTRELTRLLARK